jgi:beta-glucosidase
MGWEVYPDGLRELLVWVRDEYGNIPVYVTENGAAFADPPPGAPDGAGGVTRGAADAADGAPRRSRIGAGLVDTSNRVPDPERLRFLREYLGAVARARAAGCDVRGYFVWTLLDNFEWAFGYTKRFGLYYTDFHTQRRVLKDSGAWYAEVARTGRLDVSISYP